MNQTYKHWGLSPASELNQAISRLPKATMLTLWADPFPLTEGSPYEEVSSFRAIRVENSIGQIKYVACTSPKYRLVQHEEAFRPIIEGLTLAGLDQYSFCLNSDHKKAKLQVYAAGEMIDSVRIGFSVVNHFDGQHAIHYGFRMKRSQKSLELVGYRQVCSNGMKIRVPLDKAEIIRPEIRERITVLFSESAKINHTASAEQKLKALQYATEAISLLQEPVRVMIERAQKWTFDEEGQVKLLVKKHIGKRFAGRVLEQFKMESQDLWGLYNAVTSVASHDADISSSAQEKLLDKAATLLLEVV